jgi:hypothetical protein
VCSSLDQIAPTLAQNISWGFLMGMKIRLIVYEIARFVYFIVSISPMAVSLGMILITTI